MKRVALLCLLLAVPAIGKKNPPPPPSPLWSLYEAFFITWPLTVDTQGLPSFSFPTTGQWVAYLVEPSFGNLGIAQGPLPTPMTAGQTITITGQTTVTSGSPIFMYDTEPGNTCINPAHARPFVAKRDWTITGSEFDRWWANPTAIEIASGPATTIQVAVDPSQWTSVYGVRGDASPEAISAFYAAFGDPEMLGLSFGGGCFFGHGVYVSGGTAQFTVSAFSVN